MINSSVTEWPEFPTKYRLTICHFQPGKDPFLALHQACSAKIKLTNKITIELATVVGVKLSLKFVKLVGKLREGNAVADGNI